MVPVRLMTTDALPTRIRDIECIARPMVGDEIFNDSVFYLVKKVILTDTFAIAYVEEVRTGRLNDG